MEQSERHGKAMIFAAGLGTRLRPLTDSMPKALVPVGGEPMIRHLIEKLKAAGYDEIVVNVHHFADMLECYILDNDSFGVKISFSDERDLLLDTGGGLLHARPLLETTPDSFCPDNASAESAEFLVHNVDILSNLDFSFLDRFSPPKSAKASGTVSAGSISDPIATLVVSERKTSRYLLFDNDMRLVGWTNLNTGEIRSPYLPVGGTTADPAAGRFAAGPDSKAHMFSIEGCPELSCVTAYAFSGIHKISNAVFPELERYAEDHGEVFSIIDFYLSVCDRCPIYGFVPDDFSMIDVGKLSSLSAAEMICQI